MICAQYFRHFDTNHDLKISYQEFLAGYRNFEDSTFHYFDVGFDAEIQRRLADVFGEDEEEEKDQINEDQPVPVQELKMTHGTHDHIELTSGNLEKVLVER